MRVVSDTSPISNLAIIGRLDLLRGRYGVVRIPLAVAAELSVLGHPAAKAQITAALAEGWLVAEKAPSSPPQLPFPLDAGETEAIGLALAAQADVLLMDEKRGREAARATVWLSLARWGNCFMRARLECFPTYAARSTAGARRRVSSWTRRSNGSFSHKSANKRSDV